MSRFIPFYRSCFHPLPWALNHCRLFVQCFFSGDYIVLNERNGKRHFRTLTPSQDFWVSDFLSQTALALTEGFLDHPYYDCVPYFLKIFPNTGKSMIKKEFRKSLDTIWQIDVSSLPNNSRAFVEEMREYKEKIEEMYENIEWV